MEPNFLTISEIRDTCKTKEEKSRFTGIENNGTACFAIAALQLLFSIDDFVADVNSNPAMPLYKLHKAMCNVKKKTSISIRVLIDGWIEFNDTLKGACSVFEFLYYIDQWFDILKAVSFKYRIGSSVHSEGVIQNSSRDDQNDSTEELKKKSGIEQEDNSEKQKENQTEHESYEDEREENIHKDATQKKEQDPEELPKNTIGNKQNEDAKREITEHDLDSVIRETYIKMLNFEGDSIQGLIDGAMQKGFEFLEFKKHLLIGIDRSGNGIQHYNTKSIHINKSVSIKEQHFALKGILVHSSYNDSGHYFTYLNKWGTWFIYNDAEIAYAFQDTDHNIDYVNTHSVIFLYEQCSFFWKDVYLTSDDMKHASPYFVRHDTTQHENRLIKSMNPDISNVFRISDLLQHAFQYSPDITFSDVVKSLNGEAVINLKDKFEGVTGKITVVDGPIPLMVKEPRKIDPQKKLTVMYLNCITELMKKYNIHISVGEQNAQLTIQSCGICISNDKRALAIKASDGIINIIKEKIKGGSFVQDALTEEVVDYLGKLGINPISTDIDNANAEQEAFFDRSGFNYDWRERADQLQVEIIKDINSSEAEKYQMNTDLIASATERANKIKDIITDAFIKKVQEDETTTNIGFANSYYPELEALVKRIFPNTKMPYNAKTIARMVGSIRKAGFIKRTDHCGGKPPLITGDIEKCLICTAIDFPQWSGEERAAYLMSAKGPLKGIKIAARTINEYLNEHRFKYKKVAFSPKARNTLGAIIARRVWSYFVKNMIDENTLFLFIDESSVDGSSTRMYGRGFVGVTPTTEKALTSYSLSLLNTVVPGYGCIQQWFTQGVCADNFTSFIKQLGYIISTHIAAPKITVIGILDNCTAHKTEDVLQSFSSAEILPLFTVPYSPQINYPVECYFGNCKASINNIDALAIIRTLGFQNAIWKSWEKVNDVHGSSEATANLFAAWIVVLDQCLSAIPLGSGPYSNENKNEIIGLLKRYEARRGTNKEQLINYELEHLKSQTTSAVTDDDCQIIHSVQIGPSKQHRHRRAKEEITRDLERDVNSQK